MSNSPLWTLAEIAAATGGTAYGAADITGLVIDSREAFLGDLFIPLKDKRDGHDFIPAALKAGASASLSEVNIDQPHVRVGDSFKAMQDMAFAARRRSKAIRVGVTGSVGKTSIKEMIATIFEAHGESHKSVRSFNNHWGVPLTMARMPRETQRAVFEMGMNHAGELSELSTLLQPDIALVSLIAPAHLVHFASVDDIATAKAEIFDGLTMGGVAVLNKDDIYFGKFEASASARQAIIITFGQSPEADVSLSKLRVATDKSTAQVNYLDQAYDLIIPAVGEHWLMNAAAALAVAVASGIDMASAITSLATYTIPAGRGVSFKTVIDGKDITVLDESYNANPTSMRAAITSASQQAEGRTIAVLGDMFELGKDELELHAALAPNIEAANISRVIVTGECMRALRGALRRDIRGLWVANAELAFDALRDEIVSGDTVLIKGSNASGLGDLIHLIQSYKDEDET
ncbi:MAG: UDP-N-acetylmuramoyl-tripeptide--D-alanyl-D-alanine ligase [Maricaulaceae bacterium]